MGDAYASMQCLNGPYKSECIRTTVSWARTDFAFSAPARAGPTVAREPGEGLVASLGFIAPALARATGVCE